MIIRIHYYLQAEHSIFSHLLKIQTLLLPSSQSFLHHFQNQTCQVDSGNFFHFKTIRTDTRNFTSYLMLRKIQHDQRREANVGEYDSCMDDRNFQSQPINRINDFKNSKYSQRTLTIFCVSQKQESDKKPPYSEIFHFEERNGPKILTHIPIIIVYCPCVPRT